MWANRDGAWDHNLCRVARSYGFKVTPRSRASWQGINTALKKSFAIVGYVEPCDEEEHWSVVVALNEERIVLNDPWNGPQFTLRWADFFRRWRQCNRELIILHYPRT